MKHITRSLRLTAMALQISGVNRVANDKYHRTEVAEVAKTLDALLKRSKVLATSVAG